MGGHWWDSVWFGFVSGCATANHIVILIVMGKRKEDWRKDLKKAFDRVPEDVYGGLRENLA